MSTSLIQFLFSAKCIDGVGRFIHFTGNLEECAEGDISDLLSDSLFRELEPIASSSCELVILINSSTWF